MNIFKHHRLLWALIFQACIVFPAFSQGREAVSRWESVKNSREYLYGEGYGITLEDADKNALNDLLSKINIKVKGSTEIEERQNVDGDVLTSSSSFRQAVNTYANATLNNTEKVVLSDEPEAKVGRYIKRSEVARIFEARKGKVLEYVASAEEAETKGKIDVALKDYYWAFVLLKTLQYPDELRHSTQDGKSVLLGTYIPNRMNEIFENLNVVARKQEGDDVEIFITYKQKPVSSVDYSYDDGKDWSYPCSAQDGVGLLELSSGHQTSCYKVKFVYDYKNLAHIDKDVEDAFEQHEVVALPKAWKMQVERAKSGQADLSRTETQSNIKKPTPYQDNGTLTAILKGVTGAVSKKNYAAANSYFTPEGLKNYKQLLQYGKAKLVGESDLRFYKTNSGVVARGVKMSFSFANGARKNFTEEVVFTFNADNKIDNIVFGLGKAAEDDILGKGVWSEEARYAIMNFLENYKTAYALKNMDYIRNVFDDHAVIIVGKLVHVEREETGGDIKQVTPAHDIVVHNRYTKDEYLKNVDRAFRSNECININFKNNDVLKAGKGGEIYGIQIEQDYYSTHYGDHGYLFLLVDINNPTQPSIKVRTWQPEKDPDFGVYGLGDFRW